MVERRFDFRPPGDVVHQSHLVGQRQDVHVGGDIQVENMEVVLLAQIIGQVHKTSGSSFGDTIVNNHQVVGVIQGIGGLNTSLFRLLFDGQGNFQLWMDVDVFEDSHVEYEEDKDEENAGQDPDSLDGY